MNFLKKYQQAREKKESILCLGLDPATKELRKENIIPEKYLKEKELGEGILEFCLEMIRKTSPYISSIKVNSQYCLFLLSLEQLKELTDLAHQEGLIAILDHKLGDISDSNLPSFYYTKKAGFDALTFSPFAGNIEEATEKAHSFGLGIFVITLMSNLESSWLQKESFFGKKPLYQEIARKAALARADGIVMGATGHITEENIGKVRGIVGKKAIFLCPGIGFQGGDIKKLITTGGENLIINISRALLYAKNPEEKAREFNKLISTYYKKTSTFQRKVMF